MQALKFCFSAFSVFLWHFCCSGKPENMTTTRPSRLLVILAFAPVYIIWGSTYLGIRLAIQTLPPFLMAGTRFMTAGAILFILAIANGPPARQPFANWRR